MSDRATTLLMLIGLFVYGFAVSNVEQSPAFGGAVLVGVALAVAVGQRIR